MKKISFAKKFIALLLCLLFLLSFAGCGVGGTTNPKDFEYEEVSGGLKITKYVGKSSVVVIPSVIDDKKVISMSSSVFSGNVKLKEITLPDTFSKVSFSLFKNCEALEKIVYTGTVSEINDAGLSALPAFKSLELYCIQNSALYDFRYIIPESDTLVNITIHEIAENETLDIDLGYMEMGGFGIDREINVKMPQDIVDKYLEKEAYASYYISDQDYSLAFDGYKLCSELVSGKAFNMPAIAKNRALSKLSDEYKIKASDLRFTELNEENVDESNVFMQATAKFDGKNVIFVSRINYAGEKWDDKDGWVFFDIDDVYEPLRDEANLCLVFGVNKIKVNGVSYQVK